MLLFEKNHVLPPLVKDCKKIQRNLIYLSKVAYLSAWLGSRVPLHLIASNIKGKT